MSHLPQWPSRVAELCRELRRSDPQARKSLQAELWVLLHLALQHALAAQSRRVGRFAREDLEDLAAQKSLELLRSAECGSWEPSDRSPGEIVSYLSTVARNGLIDHARRVQRAGVSKSESLVAEAPSDPDAFESRAESPEACAERAEFVSALSACAEVLNPRSRTIWLFRVFYDMASKDIARHPEIGLKPSHVDVVLQRCRDAIRECMKRKGHATAALPPGTFVELWSRFRMDRLEAPVAADEALDVI